MARACGKIILLGEHAVVYGVPAVAAGIERGARAEACRSPAPRLVVGEHSARPDDGSELGDAYRALLGELGVTDVEVGVSLELPPGCGLGVSATVAVATARAVLAAAGDGQRGPETPSVLGAAQAWERVFHGNPSGIDATTAALGGCLRFVRGQGAEPLLLARSLRLAVAIAGPPASTRSMVEGVARLRAERPGDVQAVFDEIAALADEAPRALASAALARFGQLMDRNQELLENLGVSTSSIEQACADARGAGALGAKLTGSGGGGAVVALVDGSAEPILSAWQARGFPCFATVVSASRTANG